MVNRLKFLSAAENRATFFKRIAFFFPQSDHRFQEIERAYNVSKDAFRGIRRSGGERYFEHVRAVALILIDYLRVTDYRLIIAALLHDVVEDVPSWTIARVQREFGDYVAMLVDYLTKPSVGGFRSKDERDRVYHSRFRFAPREFFLIKLADRWHNVLSLHSCAAQKRKRKVAETRSHYLMYAEQHLILYHELVEALARADK